LIRYPRIDRNQLFDLETDPHETMDIAGRPEHQKRVAGMLAAMRAQQELFGDTLALRAENPAPGDVTWKCTERTTERVSGEPGSTLRRLAC
jgi:hypothetical protein